MIKGLDLLGFAHPLFPREMVLSLLPANYALGVFDDPFGPVLPHLEAALVDYAIPLIRIQAHWSNAHGIVPIPKLKKKLLAYEKFAVAHSATKIYVSHSCEYAEPSIKAVQGRIKLIRLLAPSCTPVNTPMRSPTTPGVRIEIHGNGLVTPGNLGSMDGTDITEMNVGRWLKQSRRAEVMFLWRSQFNMRDPGVPAGPPMERTRIPTKKEILELIAAAK